MSRRASPTPDIARPETFGQRLSRLRSDAGLSQSALARKVGASQSAISQMESGERNPSHQTLYDLAEALGVSPAYLLGAEVEELSSEEEVHFRRYRALPLEARAELLSYMDFLRMKYGQGDRSS